MFHAPALRSWISSSRSPIIMASKSKTHRLHQLSGTALQSIAKRPRTITTESYMKDAFANYAGYLNELNEKRERVVKASRDITINSKKVIFQVHRDNKEEVLKKAEADLVAVKDQYISRLVKELQGTDFWKLRRAYSPGVQEYVEAATFCKFCRTGTLLDLEELNAGLLPLSDPAIEPLQINVLDYLLGLADLTGELMRLAIGRISDGELDFAEKICRFSRDIYRELTLVVPLMDNNSDMKTKMDTMLQSVLKIENDSGDGLVDRRWGITKEVELVERSGLITVVLAKSRRKPVNDGTVGAAVLVVFPAICG
ncbi:translin-associated protein x [Citrus sinensis]|nr:translin-associated protein x [Citrus sinensis]